VYRAIPRPAGAPAVLPSDLIDVRAWEILLNYAGHNYHARAPVVLTHVNSARESRKRCWRTDVSR